MRVAALAILIGMMFAAGKAQAQTYDPAFPVCMHLVVWGGAYEDCKYYSIPQCEMSASGLGAQCNVNPFYARTIAPGRQHRH